MSATTPATPRLLWTPSASFRERSRLAHYQHWLEEHYGVPVTDYHGLWQWSIRNIASFWESVWQYAEIISHQSYREVLGDGEMPGAEWFPGSTLNYAEHVFRQATTERPAILFRSERQPLTAISWAELTQQVASFADWLRQQGVQPGDRVVAFLPNIPQATVAFLATCAVGGVWSSCSPDFGAASVLDRFRQIEPKVLITVDGYFYGGKSFPKETVVREIAAALPSLQALVWIPYLDSAATLALPTVSVHTWEEVSNTPDAALTFAAVPFSHPIWVLYSSGTTGIPKAITHSQGGVLLEHFKYLLFHNDVQPGERFFWYSTTGWMMWNFVQASLLVGATIVLYDGSPGYPDLGVLWEFAAETGIHHFGTSAPYLVACQKAGLEPGVTYNLGALRSIGSTGSPLPPETFDYIYAAIKADLWLCSMSGGTDVCTAFVGGCPLWSVYEGEIQCRALGCALFAYDEQGNLLHDEVGEMVITQPMPSMPIYFWNDEGAVRYRESYFSDFPGIWRHGDWVRITPRQGLVIYGRSDATLNRQGVRIGTAEIYRSMDKIPEIADSLIVNLELAGGRHYMPLFVMLAEGATLDESLRKRITNQLRSDYSPRHVPDEIISVQAIPYTISGKKMEAPVKKLLLGRPLSKAANVDSMRNPESFDFFIAFAQQLEK